VDRDASSVARALRCQVIRPWGAHRALSAAGAPIQWAPTCKRHERLSMWVRRRAAQTLLVEPSWRRHLCAGSTGGRTSDTSSSSPARPLIGRPSSAPRLTDPRCGLRSQRCCLCTSYSHDMPSSRDPLGQLDHRRLLFAMGPMTRWTTRGTAPGLTSTAATSPPTSDGYRRPDARRAMNVPRRRTERRST
jgi:hypothetical protein